jgi:uncharacterized secreted protein with C-terminal beta-propeller domain
MAGIGVAAAIGFVLILGSIGSRVPTGPVDTFTPGGGSPVAFVASTQKMTKFASYEELRAFLINVENSRGVLAGQYGDFRLAITEEAPASSPTNGPEASLDSAEVKLDDADQSYSTTNVQVAGVDEPDFVKNDGRYAYVLSGDKLTIAEVYPAESAKIVSKIGLDIPQGQYLQNMFLSGDVLVIFYQEYEQDYVIPQYEFAPQPIYAPKTHALVLDVSDRAEPAIVHDYEVSGAYNNARMIGDYVYLITTSDVYSYIQPVVPRVMEASRTVVMPEIYYFGNPEPYYNFNTVTSINVRADQDAVKSQSFMMNPASTLYVSEKNIYIAYQKYLPYGYYESTRERFFTAVVPLLPADVQERIRNVDSDASLNPQDKWDRIADILQDAYNRMGEQEKAQLFERIQKALAEYDANTQKDLMRTVVHRIAIGPDGTLAYGAKGEVPGRLLNQFSMDESNGRFRLATTVEYYTPYSSGLYSNVYVLNEAMETVGRLEQIEPGESIYAARFIGERLYLVTFQRIDPFFVIDLSTDQPKILGALKLPGFSNYLHPYDENHIIGIGRETKDNGFGGATTGGVKLAFFDVSDVSNPRLVDDYVIGQQGTDSEVLYDHKAFLFDREKNVLSIPISSFETVPILEGDRPIQPKAWRGFYVFGLTPEGGFEPRGQVEHSPTGEYYYYGVQGSRSFYIGDVLYTVSLNNLIKMNNISSLAELNKLDIGTTGGIVDYPVIEKQK